MEVDRSLIVKSTLMPSSVPGKQRIVAELYFEFCPEHVKDMSFEHIGPFQFLKKGHNRELYSIVFMSCSGKICFRCWATVARMVEGWWFKSHSI